MNGALLGDFPLPEALQHAKKVNLDLVLTNIASKPPICKIYNYSGELLENFKATKRKKVVVVHQETLNSKMMYLNTSIKANDLQIKVNL